MYFCDHGDEDIIDTKRLRYLPPELNRTVPYQVGGFPSFSQSLRVVMLMHDVVVY